jgi:hypothetical protein
MKIKRFDKVLEGIEDFKVCEEHILDIFGDILTISKVKISEDVEYNFQCSVHSVTEKSYYAFKILFDLIEKNSINFIYNGNECYAKIENIIEFCSEIENINKLKLK